MSRMIRGSEGALEVVTPAAVDYVTLQEAKDHLKVEVDADDALISEIVLAAIEYAQNDQARVYMPTTFDWFIDGFPGLHGVIELPRSPITSITSLKYIDVAGVQQTLDAADYQVDLKRAPGRLRPVFQGTWPQFQPDFNAVEVRFVAGYADPSSIERLTKEAILLLIGRWYAYREDIVIAGGLQGLPAPKAVDALLWHNRVSYA